MRTSTTSREEVIDRIAEVFRRYGYDGSSLALISEATGLGKASLYHHFPEGKEQMGREVFGRIGARVQRELLEPLAGDAAPPARLEAWIRSVQRFYDGGDTNCLLGAMVLSGGVDRYATEISAAFGALIDAVAATLREAGIPAATARRRAGAAVALVQGALITARGLDDPGFFTRTIRHVPDQLLREASK